MAYDIPAVAAAMDQRITQLNHITNNLANAGTSGFKSQHMRALEDLEKQGTGNGNASTASSIFTDFTQGLSQKTDNPLDMYIQGDGFFVVQTPAGQAFTRNGTFTTNKSNQLVTQTGDLVVGEGGPITLRNGKVHINTDGSIYVDESQVGKLKIVDFANRQALDNVGGGLYRDPGSTVIKNIDKPNIISGVIELSNVNIIKEMAEMIDIHRSFETYQKIIQTMSDEDKLSTSRIGRIS